MTSEPKSSAGSLWRISDAVDLGYRVDGPDGAPTVFFGPSLGTTLSLFDHQCPDISKTWRMVRSDLRGHGSSPVIAHPFTLADMAADIIALADRLDVERFSYVGVSISGAIGLALAMDYPDRLERLVVAASASYWPDKSEWEDRARRVRAEGLGFFVPSRPGIWFSHGFVADQHETAHGLMDGLARTHADSYANCCNAIGAFDARPRLNEIRAPTLIVAGERDIATPVERAQEMHAGIANSQLVIIPEAHHLFNVEQARSFNRLVRGHLADRSTA